MLNARGTAASSLLLSVAVLTLAGCGGSSEPTAAMKNRPQDAILPAPEKVAPGKPIAPFEMTDQRGEAFS